MKHEQDEIARAPLPAPRRHRDGHLLLYWTKPEPVTDKPPSPTVVLNVIHLVRRYLPSGECIWYEPADNNR